MQTHIHVGIGEDITIGELAEVVRRAVGYEGDIIWDRSKPDGTPRKLLDVSLINKMGWQARIPLEKGISDTYAQYRRKAEGLI